MQSKEETMQIHIYRNFILNHMATVGSSLKEEADSNAEHLQKQAFLCNYKGFWIPKKGNEMVFDLDESYFTPRPSDIFIASMPKSGTTWLKSLSFAVLNRHKYSPLTSTPHPLLSLNPHECVPFWEKGFRLSTHSQNFVESMPSPRLLSTHLPYSLLPSAMTVSSSTSRFIYVYRDSKDVFTSWWHYCHRYMSNQLNTMGSLEEIFEQFCCGITPFGPFWEHVHEYLSESWLRPDKVLFLKYEEMAEDPSMVLRKLAKFMGCGFSEEEEEMGLVEELIRLCSFENLHNLEQNKSGHLNFSFAYSVVQKSSFFRKGKVGDWKNLLTPEMAQKLDQITEQKLKDSNLSI